MVPPQPARKQEKGKSDLIQININETNNEEVLFGEVTPNPVRVLSYMIEYIYDPLINGEKHDWGLTDSDSKK